jgi:hypothetical protein
MLAQIPTPLPGAMESWLISAAAILSLVVLARKLFVRRPTIEAEFVTKAEFRIFRESVERDLENLRERLDARFQGLGEKLELFKSEILAAGERRGSALHQRINELESGLARVDERTRR